MNALFDDTFFASIERLSLDIGRAPAGARTGSHLSRASGASLHFRDYKPYAPGDDLRRVDWAVYGRTKHLFVRRFEQPAAINFYFAVDNSASMHLESPTRFAAAARCIGAVAAAAINAQNPIQLIGSANDSPPAMPRTMTGRNGLMHFLTSLAQVARPGEDLLAMLERCADQLANRPRGVFVIASDFFDDAGVDAIAGMLSRIRHRLVLIQLARSIDRTPDLDADTELVDAETGRRMQITFNAEQIAQHGAAYDAYFAQLGRLVSQREDSLLRIDVDETLRNQLAQMFPAGRLRLGTV